MSRQTVTVNPARGFSAMPSPSGDGVIFSVQTGDAEQHFAFPAEAVPEIVGRMIQAHSDANPEKEFPAKTIQATATAVAMDVENNTIVLSLMPTESSHFPFSLTAELAERMIEGLSEGIAVLRGQQSSSRH